MTPTLKLRQYQQDAVSKVLEEWKNGVQRPAVVMPTGTGKTVVFSVLATQLASEGHRPLILVHRDELVRQTIAKLHAVSSGITIGRIQHAHNEPGDVTVASVQTLCRELRLSQWKPTQFDRIIVDEAHHAAAISYIKIMEYFGAFDPHSDTCAVGFSATLKRSEFKSKIGPRPSPKKKTLHEVWDTVAFKMGILPAIAAGYLVDVKGYKVRVSDLDLATVATSGNDFGNDDLARAMTDAHAGEAIAAAYHRYATRDDGTLRPGICFAPTVLAAEQFAMDLKDAGIRTEIVVGTTDSDDREAIYKRVCNGDTTVIMSVMVLTEGFDLPEVEVCVVARPTKSEALYVQMVGRVLRPAPWTGKTEALVLDVSGTAGQHRLKSLADLSPGRPPMDDGETLAVPRRRAGAGQGEVEPKRPGHGIEGIDGQEMSLFESRTSANAWLRTRAGVFFIPTADSYVFLWPEDAGKNSGADMWRVGVMPKTGKGRWTHRSLSIDLAMSWAESVATDIDPTISLKGSAWRKKRPSEKMMGFARNLGIDPGNMKGGELSDLITTTLASRKFDHAKR